MLKATDDRAQILGSPMPIEFGQFDNDGGDDWIETAVQPEEIVSVIGKQLEISGVCEIEAAGKAGQNHPERKNVGQFVMMPDGVLPCLVVRNIDGFLYRFGIFGHAEVDDRMRAGVEIGRSLHLADDFHGLAQRSLQLFDTAEVLFGRLGFGQIENGNALLIELEVVNSRERRDQSVLVNFRNLPHQWED